MCLLQISQATQRLQIRHDNLALQILTRLTPSITHIVFKDGSPTTLAKHKLYDDPKPFLVGVSWVLTCAEIRERADETRFLVNEPEPVVLNGKVK